MKENKYGELFNTYMSHDEARSILFRVIDTCPKEDIPLLNEAYSAVLPAIIDRELEASHEGNYLT